MADGGDGMSDGVSELERMSPAEPRRHIHVAAAIILRGEPEGAGIASGGPRVGVGGEAGASCDATRCPLACEVLATQRGYGEFKDWWEFPGGKVKPGEASQEACVRELREELAVELTDLAPFISIDYDYPDFHLTMDCFTCRLAPGEHVSLLEHEDMRWLGREHLDEVRWLPADIEIIDALRQVLA